MKNKQKVWIRGVEGRGEEVLNALKAVGGKLKLNSANTGDVSFVIYTIDHNGYIGGAEITSETAKIIMDNYREIKLQKRWDRGAILFSPLCRTFAVCTEKEDTQWGDVLPCLVLSDNDIDYHGCIAKRDYRIANKKERKIFLERLHKLGYDFDFKTKEVVKWKWRPKDGERFYTIASDGQVVEVDNYDKDCWEPQFDFGNCFRTAQDAAEAAKKVWEVFRAK